MSNEDLKNWVNKERNLDITIVGNEVLIELFSIETKSSPLTDLDGALLSEKYGREVFNLAKIVEIGTDCKAPLTTGMIVSLPDEMLEPIPDGSQGFNQVTGEPKAGYLALGKLIPFSYLKDKIGTPKNELLFIVPSSWIKVIHNNVFVQQKI